MNDAEPQPDILDVLADIKRTMSYMAEQFGQEESCPIHERCPEHKVTRKMINDNDKKVVSWFKIGGSIVLAVLAIFGTFLGIGLKIADGRLLAQESNISRQTERIEHIQDVQSQVATSAQIIQSRVEAMFDLYKRMDEGNKFFKDRLRKSYDHLDGRIRALEVKR